MKNQLTLLIILFSAVGLSAQNNSTYCNPVNLDYPYTIDTEYDDISFRSGGDPAVVKFRDIYYLFLSDALGYWSSRDMNNWEFIEPKKWYFEGSKTPTAHNYKDSVLYLMANPYGSMSVLYTDDPKEGNWKGEPSILNRLRDPELFIDENDQAYLYSSPYNQTHILGKELDLERSFRPGEDEELISLDPETQGWEVYNEDSEAQLQVHMEGPWITRHQDKYYLQYAVPGTEPHLSAVGAYISDDPLGPFEKLPHNPISFKPGGFLTGTGNGDLTRGPDDAFWLFSTMKLNANNSEEKRLGMFKADFDEDGLLYSDTYFGDYPRFAPTDSDEKGEFTGWMLLSYKKPVSTSSNFEDYRAENIVDEDIRSFWVAEENNEEQWVEIDLEKLSNVYAVQVNYHDYEADMYGKTPDFSHRYIIEGSQNGQNWTTIIDKSDNKKNQPHDYVELEDPQKFRFIRFKNIEVSTPFLSISGLRIFGKGEGKAPKRVKRLNVDRGEDSRQASLAWRNQKNAQGYNVLWGIAPDKLYNSWMVYDENELELNNLNKDQTYYFAIEAFNENGISKRTKPVKID